MPAKRPSSSDLLVPPQAKQKSGGMAGGLRARYVMQNSVRLLELANSINREWKAKAAYVFCVALVSLTDCSSGCMAGSVAFTMYRMRLPIPLALDLSFTTLPVSKLDQLKNLPRFANLWRILPLRQISRSSYMLSGIYVSAYPTSLTT